MLYAGFERILKPVDEQYNEKMNQRKTQRRGKTLYKEKFNAHIPSGWCVHNTFADRDVFDPLKIHCDKLCLEKVMEHIAYEVKQLYATFPQKTMMLTKAAEKCHICLKEFNEPENRKGERSLSLHGFKLRNSLPELQLEITNTRQYTHSVSQPK